MSIASFDCRRARRRSLCVGWLVASASLALAAPSLRDVLSPEEFQRGGLNKLSETELTFLSARLLGLAPAGAVAATEDTTATAVHVKVLAALPAGDDAFGQEQQVQAEVQKHQQVPREIDSRIEGPFAGWSGRSVFHLANGQTWQQCEPAELAVALDSPAVTIRKGRFGAFYLRVHGYGSQVKVKRIN